MNSDWLESFLIFSDTLNFTRAAERLHISQPALHVKITKLSEFIGKPLYQKSGRNLQLTAEGLQLQAFARDQSEQTNNMLKKLRSGTNSEEVCLSAGEGTFLYLLGKSVPVFKKRSSAKLRVRTGNQSKVISDVLSGTAHIGITPMETSHESLISSPYTRVGQIVVMPTTHPLASKRKLKIEHLQGQALIVPPEDKPHRILINRLLMSAQIDWQVAVEVNGWELMLHFAKQGIGLAIINEYCKVPKGLTARALPEFPSIQFQLIKRRFGSTRPAIAELEEILFSHKESWKNEHRQR